MKRHAFLPIAFALLLGALPLIPSEAFAHCDTLDGPVIKDATAALANKDVTPVLKWVRSEDEAEIRTAFDRALAVRSKGDAARDLADTYFFETLVRVHRAGEGAPYTGLKPAGSVAHIEAAADASLAGGSPDKIVAHLAKAMTDGIRDRFEKARTARAGTSVEAGREYVHAYVEYLHYVSGLFDQVAKGGAHAHGEAAHEDAHGR
ncbi:MAG: hypothetical protein C4523_20620 [Myxococcales bacterium]|nr:MAG: hypothetical protein C4523_20620 [Myxococcales bacterium]